MNTEDKQTDLEKQLKALQDEKTVRNYKHREAMRQSRETDRMAGLDALELDRLRQKKDEQKARSEDLRRLKASSTDGCDSGWIFFTYTESGTLLADLYEALGSWDALINFINIFEGRTITIPHSATLLQNLRDVTIFVKLRTNDHPEVRARLAEEYKVSAREVGDIYEKVRAFMDDLRGQVL